LDRKRNAEENEKILIMCSTPKVFQIRDIYVWCVWLAERFWCQNIVT